MAKQKHQGGLKERLAAQQASLEEAKEHLAQMTKTIEAKEKSAASNITVDSIARHLCSIYNTRAIRNITTFNRSLKSKDGGKIRLAVAAHLFARYKVPSYLQECWYVDSVTQTVAEARWCNRFQHHAEVQVSTQEIALRRDWYITAASGGSLFKNHAKGLLTKGEVHAFLTCSIPCNFREAIIYALTTQWTKDVGIASRVMKSKLNKKPGIYWLKEPIWREVIHFFCVNSLTFSQMNDLVDYFDHAHAQARQAKTEYSLKGRTLQSLTRQMQDWHWELARVKKMGDARWDGIPIADEEITINGRHNETWFFNQLKTSKELAAEGTAMHHCVYGYQTYCVNGTSSIWSLKRHQHNKTLAPERVITLEINQHGRVVQIRGFANRPARPEELEAIRIWVRKNSLSIGDARYC